MLAVSPPVSVAVTVTEYSPRVVSSGAPLITPVVASIVIPAGKPVAE